MNNLEERINKIVISFNNLIKEFPLIGIISNGKLNTIEKIIKNTINISYNEIDGLCNSLCI